MTKQPARPTRYFPGKALAEDPVSDDESEEESDEEARKAAPKAAAPKATSFPKKLAVDLSKPSTSTSIPAPKPEDDLEGFVTASESEDEDATKAASGSDDEEEDSSEEEESSSDDEPKRPMLAPKFISKAKRAQQASATPEVTAEDEERVRKEKADALLQAQIEKDIALRAAGKKNWDDDDVEDEVDDTDDLDVEAERAAWKLRELKRVKRDREALIAKEKEREEVERRRNMTAEEREAADREYIAAQEEEREGKGKMGFMQKYFHKGAFFNQDDEDMDEEVREALNRDTAGRKFVDDTGDKAVLPEYMRIRDMTRLGKKGRTRYKDLKSEDTGRWGEASGRRKGDFDGLDDRFRPDERAGDERTGANDVPVGERRRRDDDGGRGGEGKRPRYD
jgi:microfibrillar-associated protein 1